MIGLPRSTRKNASVAFNGRRLRLESLESRELLAIEVSSWEELRTAINNAIAGVGDSDIEITADFTRGRQDRRI